MVLNLKTETNRIAGLWKEWHDGYLERVLDNNCITRELDELGGHIVRGLEWSSDEGDGLDEDGLLGDSDNYWEY